MGQKAQICPQPCPQIDGIRWYLVERLEAEYGLNMADFSRFVKQNETS